jgi:hypothetical protein
MYKNVYLLRNSKNSRAIKITKLKKLQSTLLLKSECHSDLMVLQFRTSESFIIAVKIPSNCREQLLHDTHLLTGRSLDDSSVCSSPGTLPLPNPHHLHG